MKKKNRLYLLALVIISTFVFSSFKNKKEYNNHINFNADWKFKLLEEKDNSSEEFAIENFNDADWEKVSLPHTSHLEPLLVNNQWQGICWYRKSFSINKSQDFKKVFLTLEAAMNYSKIWINGKLIKTHQGGYLPIIMDMSDYLHTGKNTIAIRLDNKDNNVTGPKPLKILDFNMYGGLYRNAFLTYKKSVYITNPNLVDKVAGGGLFITYPKVSQNHSIVHIKTNVVNESESQQKIEILNKVYLGGRLIKEQKTIAQQIAKKQDIDFEDDISIDNAELWSPKSPNLYQLETIVLVNGKMVDSEKCRFGIRKFEFKNNNLYINNEQTFLRGVNRHQEYPFIGYALSDNAQYRDAKKIKEAGFDYIRLSHYPQSPAFLDACDELGLVVADAILGWQYYGDNDAFRNYCYTSAQQLIRRDRNHASVLAWEVSLNETSMPVFFMEKLNEIVHQEYPGKNVYSCGWLDNVYDIYFQARQHRLKNNHELKDIPYAVSEYGDWEYYSTDAGLNQDRLPKNLRVEKSSRQLRSYGEKRLLYQLNNVIEAHNDNLNTRAFADGYWVMYDYNRGYQDDLESSGLMDIFRIPKFAYYFYQSQREVSDKPVLKIATYWNEESPLDVKVLSNCEQVKLYLNNRLIATQKPDININTKNLTHPPFSFTIPKFEEGTLKAVGLLNNKKVISEEVKTPQKPIALKIWTDESGRRPQAGQNDIVFVYIAAVDKNETIIPDYEGAIKLIAKGDAQIFNLQPIKAEAGIATALIKIGLRNNSFKIYANSNKLKQANFKINLNRK